MRTGDIEEKIFVKNSTLSKLSVVFGTLARLAPFKSAWGKEEKTPFFILYLSSMLPVLNAEVNISPFAGTLVPA